MKKQFYHKILLSTFLFCLVILLCAHVNAEIPDSNILKQLENRLTEKSHCLPHCADISNMYISIISDRLKIEMTVHAAVDTIVPLPATEAEWMPQQILCDSEPLTGIRKDDQKHVWIFVKKGIHKINLSGISPNRNQFHMPLVLKPKNIQMKTIGWDIQGVSLGGQIADSLQLNRQKQTLAKKDQNISIPPFFHVQRVLYISVQWRVITTVTQMTPADNPVSIEIPLLSGESLVTGNIQVKDNKALISMKAKQSQVEWQSVLAYRPNISLTAPETNQWVETWILDADTKQHVTFDGIPVIHHQDSQKHHRPSWKPWPGEKVNIHISQLTAIPGKNITIDNVKLDWYPGIRFHQAKLTMSIRVSMGQSHTINLPEKAIVQHIHINRRSLPVLPEENAISLPLDPGNHLIEIKWHQHDEKIFFFCFPKISIGTDAVNTIINMHLPGNAWILWAKGPQLGPVVLFWSYTIVLALIAFALGRIEWSPLKTWQWFLLGLGLTQIHIFEAIVVVGWFLVFYQRKKYHMPDSRWLFNFRQLGLIVWTFAALCMIYMAIHSGLLGIPDMQIKGNDSTWKFLSWYQDRIIDNLPRPWIISLPLYVFRTVMLVWALWMAQSLIKWLRWMWGCFSAGDLWRKKISKAAI
ncbi:conserved hypothetical protein, membrane [Candidatus Magnetomorum sp. HK-1]|nr:conserved hypothetical protein, membrane [Candidatus Magnetomorum sp. HK-1]